MPKLKTHRGAAKRFRKLSSGKIKRKRAYRNHILTKKSTKLKRGLRVNDLYMSDADKPAVDRLLTGS